MEYSRVGKAMDRHPRAPPPGCLGRAVALSSQSRRGFRPQGRKPRGPSCLQHRIVPFTRLRLHTTTLPFLLCGIIHPRCYSGK